MISCYQVMLPKALKAKVNSQINKKYEYYYKVNDIERYSFKEISNAVNNPIILHSTSFYYWKAWEEKCIHPYHPIYAKYFHELGLQMQKTDNKTPNELLFDLRLLGSLYLPRELKDKVKEFIK